MKKQEQITSRMFTQLLIAAISISQPLTVSSAAYVKTGECMDDQTCQYSYTADQQHGDDTSNAVIASATVDIICQSAYPQANQIWANLRSHGINCGLEPYKLAGIRVTDRELGHGSYATVLELEYMGLKCAGKKIHEVLLRQGDRTYTVHRFETECRLLSQVRHPNIVQFLGVYFQQRVQAPILIMDFLPINLTSCIEQYGILPKENIYSILHDVSLGLHYLHNQTPSIIHRDLSSNNILLTPNMTAKISDLGVARILNLNPLQVSRMTQTPGTPAYMPPEVMIANPMHDVSVDEFSYGIMMIHLLSGRWPEPQVGQICTERGRMIPVSEAERREVFLRTIGNDHPLMNLILRCINNDPKQILRAHTNVIVKQLADLRLQFPVIFSNRLEMQAEIVVRDASLTEKELELKAMATALKEKDDTISKMRDQLTRMEDYLASGRQTLVGINWKQDTDLPIESAGGPIAILGSNIVYGGGTGDYIYCYDQCKWVALPQLPVKWFGLGLFSVSSNEQTNIVAVGGKMKGSNSATNTVYSITINPCSSDNEETEPNLQWSKEEVPPMPTARYSSSIVNTMLGLVVIGGYADDQSATNAVEILIEFEETLQWLTTDSLPIACHSISVACDTHQTTCYVVGRYKESPALNRVFCAPIMDLISNADPSLEIDDDGFSPTRDIQLQSAWKELPNTPIYNPAACILADSLVIVGESHKIPTKHILLAFSQSTNSWVYVTDMPADVQRPTIANVSNTRLLMISGNAFFHGKLSVMENEIIEQGDHKCTIL